MYIYQGNLIIKRNNNEIIIIIIQCDLYNTIEIHEPHVYKCISEFMNRKDKVLSYSTRSTNKHTSKKILKVC